MDHILGMMERAEWQRGRSAKALAAEWREPESTVRNYSQEAWAVLKREIQDIDAVKTDVATILRRTIDQAVDAGKFSDVAKLGDVLTRILGARVADKHEVVTMTEEQAAKRWEELTGKPWEPKQ